jgi:hypothetical protein
MTCAVFRRQHARFSRMPLPREVWDTPAYEAWSEHLGACAACQAWSLHRELEGRAVDVSQYPCAHIAAHATHRCEQHPDPQDCPDVLVRRLPGSDLYGIPIRDGGSAVSVIRYCPWCGTAMPEPPPGSGGRRIPPRG